MDSTNEIISTDTEEEDPSCFFLQPAVSPYNITEKVQQANLELTNYNVNIKKDTKVTFRETLVTFEPELTDDDVNSIESDHLESDSADYKTITKLHDLTIFNIEEEEEEPVLFEEEYIEEEVENASKQDDAKEEEKELIETEIRVVSSRKKPNNAKGIKKKLWIKEVDCKQHCIEEIEYDLSETLKNLNIQDKFPEVTPLKLHQRKCCEHDEMKSQKCGLPQYNGLRSEYGLTLRQLEKKEKLKELTKLREAKKKQLKEECRKMKIQENERVFCRWLKDVQKRRNCRQSKKLLKKRSKSAEVVTQKKFSLIVKNKKRPNTSSCIFVTVNVQCDHLVLNK